MRITFLLLILVLSINAAYAATYYVDSVSGNDANNGQSPSAAWKAVSKVNSYSFIPGDNILFHRGQIWRETLTIPSGGNSNNYITFGSYGSGGNPVISGSNLADTGWSPYSMNVWKVSVSTQPNIIYFDGIRGNSVSGISSISVEYDWYWSSGILYVWSINNGDPSLYYINPGIEAGKRDRVLETNDKSYIIFDGLTIRDGNGAVDSSINVGSNSVVGVIFQNCVIERGTFRGISVKGSSAALSIKINNCTIQNNGDYGIWIPYPFAQGSITNSTISGNGWGALMNVQVPSGIDGYLGNFDISGNMIYSNDPVCYYTDMQCHGIYVHASSAVANIHDNVIYSNTYGSGIKTRGSANIYRNRFYNNDATAISLGGNGATNIVVNAYYNLIYNNNLADQMGGVHEGSKGSGSLDFSFMNNLLYNNGGSEGAELIILDNLASLNVENNIFFTNGDRHTVQIASQSGPTTIDYNIHWRADGNPSINYGGSGKTWSQWQSLGFDQHGMNQDPYLNNPSGVDFSLQNNSPAINAGIDVGLTSDFFGNPIVGNPDIGAIEYNSGQYNPADTNRDGCISISEISVYVSLWLQGTGGVTLGDVSAAVAVWLGGCHNE